MLGIVQFRLREHGVLKAGIMGQLSQAFTSSPAQGPPRHTNHSCENVHQLLKASIDQLTSDVQKLQAGNTTVTGEAGTGQQSLNPTPSTAYVKLESSDKDEVVGVSISDIDSSTLGELYNSGLVPFTPRLEAVRLQARFESGSYNTLVDYPQGLTMEPCEQTITFKTQYSEDPGVIIWLNAFHVGCEKPWRVRVRVKKVTNTDLTFVIDTGGGSVLYSASVSWIAYDHSSPAGLISTLGGTIRWSAAWDAGVAFATDGFQPLGTFRVPKRAVPLMLAVNPVQIAVRPSLPLLFEAKITNGTYSSSFTAEPGDTGICTLWFETLFVKPA